MPIWATEYLRTTPLTSAPLKSTSAPVLTDTQSKYKLCTWLWGCMPLTYNWINPVQQNPTQTTTQPTQSIKGDSYTLHSIKPFQNTLQHYLTLFWKSSIFEKTKNKTFPSWVSAKPYKIFSSKIIMIIWNRLQWWRTSVHANFKDISKLSSVV